MKEGIFATPRTQKARKNDLQQSFVTAAGGLLSPNRLGLPLGDDSETSRSRSTKGGTSVREKTQHEDDSGELPAEPSDTLSLRKTLKETPRETFISARQRANSGSSDDVFLSARQRSNSGLRRSNSGEESFRSGVQDVTPSVGPSASGMASGRSEAEDDIYASARHRSSAFSLPSEELFPADHPARREFSPHDRQEHPSRPKVEIPPSDDRLGRMEALMEQLLLFSTEQTIRREQRQSQPAPPSAPASEELALLREEISELRSDLNRRSEGNDSAAEIAALREELAWLRGQMNFHMPQHPPGEQTPVQPSTPTRVQNSSPVQFAPFPRIPPSPRPPLPPRQNTVIEPTAVEPADHMPEIVESSPESHSPPEPVRAGSPIVRWLSGNQLRELEEQKENVEEVD